MFTILQILYCLVRIYAMKNGGLGGEAPNKLLKGPSGKVGGPFDVACTPEKNARLCFL